MFCSLEIEFLLRDSLYRSFRHAEAMNRSRSGGACVYFLTDFYAVLSWIILLYFTVLCCAVNAVGNVFSVVVSPAFGLLYSGATYKYSGY